VASRSVNSVWRRSATSRVAEAGRNLPVPKVVGCLALASRKIDGTALGRIRLMRYCILDARRNWHTRKLEWAAPSARPQAQQDAARCQRKGLAGHREWPATPTRCLGWAARDLSASPVLSSCSAFRPLTIRRHRKEPLPAARLGQGPSSGESRSRWQFPHVGTGRFQRLGKKRGDAKDVNGRYVDASVAGGGCARIGSGRHCHRLAKRQDFQ